MISKDALRAIVGDLDDAKIVEILNLQPTLAELEEAAVWASGDGDVLGKQGRPMTETVSALVDILTADEEEPPPIR
jgi:hypothetical protein